MSVRIITIDPTCQDHWDFAKRNGFWDLLNYSRQLHPGDVVVFWVTGTPGKVVGHAVVDSEPEPIARDSPHAWSRRDRRKGTYTHRIWLRDFEDVPGKRVRFGEIKPKSRLTPVTALADAEVSALESQIGETLAAHGLGPGDSSSAGAGRLDFANMGDDRRDRVPGTIVARRGQGRFRSGLLAAYDERCAVTGTVVTEILEAAHISPYKGDHTNHLANGILLRADIHTLFDLHLLTITHTDDEGYAVRVHPAALGAPYAASMGRS